MPRINKKMMYAVSLLVGVTLLSAGCEPLRKKFRRQKKEVKKEEFIPVLDPIDYPPSRVSSVEKYKYHFSLWQVWSKDLRHMLDEETMDKRKKYLMAQMVQELADMKEWTPAEYIPHVDQALKEYGIVQKELDKPEIMRNQGTIEGRIRRTENYVRNTLDPEIVFNELTEE
jgi:hypothetical protein